MVFYKGSFIPTAGGPKPSPTEIERDRLSVRRRKVGVNNDAGRRGRRPLQTNKEIHRESIKICVSLCRLGYYPPALQIRGYE